MKAIPKPIETKKNPISGVPYLLGDDDEVANQRASWVPL